MAAELPESRKIHMKTLVCRVIGEFLAQARAPNGISVTGQKISGAVMHPPRNIAPALLIASATVASSASAAVIYVNAAAPVGGDGTSWKTAFNDLIDGLDAAAAGDELWLVAGTYVPGPPNGDRNLTFSIPSGVAVYGGFDGTEASLEERDFESNITILSGDLNGNDVGDPNDATRTDNSYHVVSIVNSIDVLIDGFTITGGNASLARALANAGAGVLADASSAHIGNCRIQANYALLRGGGLYARSSTLVMECCDVSHNWVATPSLLGHGGGISLGTSGSFELEFCSVHDNVLLSGPSPTLGGTGGGLSVLASTNQDLYVVLSDCNFVNNQGRGAGGVYLNHELTNVEIRRCSFLENSSNYGAGGLLTYSPSTIENCDFVKNHALNPSWNFPGGAATWTSLSPVPIALTNCRFLGNTGAKVAGALHSETTCTLTNCFFSGNSAIGNAGAIMCQWGTLTINNCTVSENSTPGAVGGVLRAGGSVHLKNSIAWGNTSSVPVLQNQQVFSLTSVNHSCIQGLTSAPGVGNIGSDPLFVDADGPDDIPGTEDDDVSLQPGSPCIDAADNTAFPPGIKTDLVGNPRFVDDPETTDTGVGTPPVIDMGAIEFQPANPSTCPGDVSPQLGDGVVNVDDLLMVINHWNGPGPEGDANGNNIVNFDDLLLVINQWGPCD